MRNILINGRTVTAKLTGVQRYFRSVISLIKTEAAIAIPSRNFGAVGGHLWEQFVLPLHARNSVLWSPANTGPILFSRQVLTVHDVAPLDHPEWQNWKFGTWYRFLLPRLVVRVRRVIAVSEFTKSRLIAKTKVLEENVVVIHNGVDERFQPHAGRGVLDIVCELRLPTRRYMLTVGTIEPRKNLKRLLAGWKKALSSIPEDVWLVIAGDRGSLSIFGKTAGVVDLPPRVHFAGRVDDSQLPALYAGALAFAYLSEYEGFGLPPLEAMASGVPVLVPNSTVFPEIVGDAGLFVDPSSIADIADGIVRILVDREHADELVARGLKRAEFFSWKKCASLTMQVIIEVANER